MSKPIAILSAVRTPIGGMLGSLSSLSAPDLGALAIAAAIERSGADPSKIDEVLMGSVLTAGQGQAPARQAALAAGLAQSTSCTTINKVCGSAMKSVMVAGNTLRSGQSEIIVAGGMESMSRAPYLIPQGRQGYRFGHAQILDHMQKDGLVDAFDQVAMGTYADATATKYHISRADQDAFAIESYRRSAAAWESGVMQNEIVPVSVPQSPW